uniref:Sarcosine oxidasee (formaldehyde-forming) n=1 Tax=Ditylenchus dipsaci TaxID=166011 RepID=A0A915CYB5_9BILA
MEINKDSIFDAIVIGSGIVGSGCAYQLAKSGKKTLIIEQFEIGHNHGSSHGGSRIILAALEQLTGEQLIVENGVIWLADAASTKLRSRDLQKFKIDHEILVGPQIRKKFPHLHYDDPKWHAIYESKGGTMLADKCLKAVQSQYLAQGGQMHCKEKILRIISTDNDLVEVYTQLAKYTTRKLVVAAGPWLSTLLPELPIRTTAQLVGVNFWKVREKKDVAVFQPQNKSPTVLVSDVGEELFMLPCVDFEDKVKFAVHLGVAYDPQTRKMDAEIKTPEWMRDMVGKHIGEHIPMLDGSKPAVQDLCVYTMTDDQNLIVDRHPFYPNILIAGGMCGIGFKFALTVGQIITAMANGEEVNNEFDLNISSSIKLENSLSQSNDQKNVLVLLQEGQQMSTTTPNIPADYAIVKPARVYYTQSFSIASATTATIVLHNPTARRFPDISIEGANMSELEQYKDELNSMLNKVEEAMKTQETLKTRPKHFSPISSSLPNRLSALFRGRVNAALNFSPNLDGNEDRDRFTQSPIMPKEQKKSAEGHFRAESLTMMSPAHRLPFNPTKNHSAEECKHLSQAELVNELKQKGTYNPDLMAWDVSGVFRFLDRSIVDQYERQAKSRKSSQQAFQRNVEALERLLDELNLQCNVTSPDVVARISNLTMMEPRRSILSPSIRLTDDEIRRKRHIAEDLVHSFNSSKRRDDLFGFKKQKVIGDVHVVPFGCDKRGEEEDGYLRLCGACQAIRKLPDSFFPPFINEVMCDEDKACLYFYDYRKY